MKIDVNKLFESSRGRGIFEKATLALKEFGMSKKMNRGALVGFSGGADSVMLLCFLKKYYGNFEGANIIAVHVNHMIRGDEADRDEAFSREFCKALGVEFIALKYDVPSEAKKMSCGLEEVARNIRYRAFEDILCGRNDISCIAIAHNATDNLETALFNMMRGTGARGASGIAPVRDNIVRPLIFIPKRDIVAALEDNFIPYVIDSTNAEIDYKRNYIRSEILPKLFYLTENPEAQFTKLSLALRADGDYLDGISDEFIKEYGCDCVPTAALLKLHPAILARVLIKMAKSGGACGCEATHINKVSELLFKDFSIDIPGGVSFISEGGKLRVGKPAECELITYEIKLKKGINEIPEINKAIIVSDLPFDNFSSKVYKISIQRIIDFDIINGELFVREKRNGDVYVYGKITRKLKKIFNDKRIPPHERPKIPIICDGDGILWVPGFPVRDGGNKNPERKLFIAVADRVNNI